MHMKILMDMILVYFHVIGEDPNPINIVYIYL